VLRCVNFKITVDIMIIIVSLLPGVYNNYAGRASTNFFTRRRRLQVSYRYSNIKTDILRLFKIKNSGKVR